MLVEMSAKDTPSEVSEGNEKYVTEAGGKAILVTKQQKTWLKCVMLDGKQNSYGVNWDIQMRFPSKVFRCGLVPTSSLW